MDLVSGCLSFTCGSFTLTMWYGLVRTRTRRVYDTVDIVYIIYKHTHLIIIEGSLKVKLPTIWTDGKAEVGRVREEKVIKKKIREEKSQKKEDAGARKGRKVASHCVFARRCGKKHISKSKGRKHLSVGPLVEVDMSKKCTPFWREPHFEVKRYKTPHVRSSEHF